MKAVEPGLSWPLCLDLALEHNPDFQLAQLRIEETEGVILEKNSKFLPHLQAGMVSLPPTLYFSFAQPIYSTAMGPANRSYKLGRSAARINVQLSLLELIYKLRTAFTQSLYATQWVEINRQNAAILKDRLQRAPSLFDAGKLTKGNLAALEVRTRLAEEELSNSLRKKELARLDLLQVIGISARDRSVAGNPAGDLEDKVPNDLDIQRLVNFSLHNRLDLQLARKLKTLDKENVLIAKAPLYPLPAFFGDTVLTSNPPRFMKSLTDALDPQSSQQDENNRDVLYARASIGAEISWRLYDGGETRGRIQTAQAETMKQDALVKELERNIPVQVEQAVKTLQSVLKTEAELKRKNFKNENLELARQAFEAGQVSQLEILDALEQSALFDGQKLKLAYDKALALATLDRATGEGIQILDEEQKDRTAQKSSQ